MNIRSNVSLADYSTMRLGGNSKFLCDITHKTDIPNALEWANQKNLPVIMIGGGSNLIWSDKGFEGLVMVNKITGFTITDEDKENSYVTIGSGEIWDSVVERTVDAGLHGIEALSLIPGTTGGTPVQNVGAYGQEIANTLVSVEAYDTQTKNIVTIPAEYCNFGYRTSRFKTTDRDRFYITEIRLHLTKTLPEPPYYPAVQKYIDEHSISKVTPKILRDIVIAIRSSKLPKPSEVANTGSFFGNPIISKSTFEKLQSDYPAIPGWDTDDGQIKVSAAWLIEQTGFKDFHDIKTGFATWPTRPLVLVNENAKHTADLLVFRDRIQNAVYQKFKIKLVQEPELI